MFRLGTTVWRVFRDVVSDLIQPPKSHVGKLCSDSRDPSSETCISCYSTISAESKVLIPCEHIYCLDCLSYLVAQTNSKKLPYPVRCCGEEIPPETFLSKLPPLVRAGYMERAAENAVPAKDRWYCPAASCERWIQPAAVNKEAPFQRCPHCGIEICSDCRGRRHLPRDCHIDATREAFLAEAKLQGWKLCCHCGAMVELISGCDHVHCICGMEFCYTCGNHWPRCVCNGKDIEDLDESHSSDESCTPEERRRSDVYLDLDDEIGYVVQAILRNGFEEESD